MSRNIGFYKVFLFFVMVNVIWVLGWVNFKKL